MRIDEKQVIEVDEKEKKKTKGKAVKSIENNDSSVVAKKVKNTNLRAKVKTKTGINDDTEEKVYKDRVKKNFTKISGRKKKDIEFDDVGLKKKVIIFLICMFIGFVIYYVIGANANKSTNYFASAKEATVAISSYNNNSMIRSGTGFVYKKDDYNGYIVTSYYTVSNGKSFKVRVANEVIDANLLGGDKYLNIAVLSIDKDYVKSVAKIGNSKRIKSGAALYALGMPNSNNNRLLVTKGYLSYREFIDVKVDSQNYAVDVLTSDVSVGKGDSGAPLCNKEGLVVGLVISKVSGKDVVYSIPINDVKDNLYMFEKGNHIIRPYIGITVFNVENYDLIKKYNLTNKVDSSLNEGVVIAAVKGSSKSYGTLKRGDVVLKVEDESINNVAKFRYELFKYTVGDNIKMTINRNGVKQKVSVVLGEFK